MKKYCFLLLTFLISVITFAQAKVVIRYAGDSIHYLEVDGQNLQYYILAKTIKPDSPQLYHLGISTPKPLSLILYTKEKNFNIYVTPNSRDTITLAEGILNFEGDNKLHNQLLEALDESNSNFIEFSKNEELKKVTDFKEFEKIIYKRKKQEDELLAQDGLCPLFVKQQKVLTDLKFRLLALRKIFSLYNSPGYTEEWAAELLRISEIPADHNVRSYSKLQDLLEGLVITRHCFIEKKDLPESRSEVNELFFQYLPQMLTGENLSFALGNVIYEDCFQENYSENTPALYERYKDMFPDNAYNSILTPPVNDIIRFHQHGAKGEFTFVPNCENFDELIKMFSGKVVYVDIWATWCGPCRKNFQYTEALKEAIKGLGVELLYISVDNDEDEEKWRKMIPFYKLAGSHIRGDDEFRKSIYSQFGTNGLLAIPRYIIVDKAGQIVNERAESPENLEKLVEQLRMGL